MGIINAVSYSNNRILMHDPDNRAAHSQLTRVTRTHNKLRLLLFKLRVPILWRGIRLFVSIRHEAHSALGAAKFRRTGHDYQRLGKVQRTTYQVYHFYSIW